MIRARLHMDAMNLGGRLLAEAADRGWDDLPDCSAWVQGVTDAENHLDTTTDLVITELLGGRTDLPRLTDALVDTLLGRQWLIASAT